jgi:hypothetical protein
MLDRIVSLFTSLKLTVTCLILGMLLVFFGTLGQESLGLYGAQQKFFRSWLVIGSPFRDMTLPIILPGGYLLGTVLLINLLAAHAKRFKFTKKKIGILMVHAGLILLLVGQLSTDLFSVESQMRLTEGESKSYSESGMKSELVIIDKSSTNFDQVVSIPEAMLARKETISHPDLPFTVRVKEFFPNSDPAVRPPMVQSAPAQASEGIANRFRFEPKELTYKMDSRNIPSAVVEIASDKGVLGSWLVSNWGTEEVLLKMVAQEWNQSLGSGMGDRLAAELSTPQEFNFAGRTFQIALRPVRYYEPYEIGLREFRHDKYLGTEVPKNFSSLVQLKNPQTGENREVKIYMNNPLRYAGNTYYQASFDPRDARVTVLQVVRNPGWLTPYFACILVGLGLVVQFMTHLIGFATRRRMA